MHAARRKNGFGFSIETITQKLQRIEEAFTLFTGDEKAIFQQWKQLVKHHNVKGTKVHDTRLVAAMLVHGLTHILTFNINDFQRFNEITATHPKNHLSNRETEPATKTAQPSEPPSLLTLFSISQNTHHRNKRSFRR